MTASCFALLGLACSDAVRQPASVTDPPAQHPSLAASPLVPAYHYDPPDPRPFDHNSELLDKELDATSRRAVIQVKTQTARRSLDNGGFRQALQAVDFSAAIAAFQALGIPILKQYDHLGMALVEIPGSATAAVAASPFVDFIDPDRAVQLQVGLRSIVSIGRSAAATTSASAQPHSPSTWTSPRSISTAIANDLASEYATNWGVAYLNAASAWQKTTGANVKVMHMSAFGLSLGHWDLPAITSDHRGGYFGPCNGTWSYLENRSATAWFALRNGYETVGIAPGVLPQDIWVWRACNDQGICYFSTIADGMSGAYDVGVKVLSFADLSFKENNATMSSAVAAVLAKDMVLVAPAIGNANQYSYPANYTGVVGVSGILSDGTFAFTNAPNNPCASGSGYGPKVAIAAPFYETKAVDAAPASFATGAICGNWVATDYVAGVVTLIRSAFPTLNAAGVKDKLFASARPAGDAQYFGAGIANAGGAVSTLSATISGPSSVKPFATCSWSADAFGGTAPYTFEWMAVSTRGSGPTFDYTNGVASGGSFTIHLTVTDAIGAPVYVDQNVTVSSSAPNCIF